MRQEKDESGRFQSKSEQERKVRSIRATDQTWEDFGVAAESRSITRADLLEIVVGDKAFFDKVNSPSEGFDSNRISRILEILEESLTYKSNAGGKIKDKVREAIALLKDG